ncbi:hypothetical protein BST61_g900 [Cercospora zeina]
MLWRPGDCLLNSSPAEAAVASLQLCVRCDRNIHRGLLMFSLSSKDTAHILYTRGVRSQQPNHRWKPIDSSGSWTLALAGKYQSGLIIGSKGRIIAHPHCANRTETQRNSGKFGGIVGVFGVVSMHAANTTIRRSVIEEYYKPWMGQQHDRRGLAEKWTALEHLRTQPTEISVQLRYRGLLHFIKRDA